MCKLVNAVCLSITASTAHAYHTSAHSCLPLLAHQYSAISSSAGQPSPSLIHLQLDANSRIISCDRNCSSRALHKTNLCSVQSPKQPAECLRGPPSSTESAQLTACMAFAVRAPTDQFPWLQCLGVQPCNDPSSHNASHKAPASSALSYSALQALRGPVTRPAQLRMSGKQCYYRTP